MICPFISALSMEECRQEKCALWCNADGCAIKKIALELVKIGEGK
jgi:hypothetical protein